MTYGNVLATVAMFLALSGSAVAGTLVTGSSVKDSSLTGRDIKNGSVTGSDVKDGSLTTADFRPGQVPGAGAGAAGEREPAGPRGDAGERGPAGPVGPAGQEGQAGEKGDPGDQGPKGAKGEDGSKGDKGDRGEKGEKGDKGDPGFVDTAGLAHAGTLGASPQVIAFGGSPNCLDSHMSSATVDVGPSGLVQIYAEASILNTGTSQARVQLYEPTSLASCPTILRGVLGTSDAAVKRTSSSGDSGTLGLGSPVLVHVAPGRRTFSLRLGASAPADPNGSMVVRDAMIWVQPL
jgi:hypothetical protein